MKQWELLCRFTGQHSDVVLCSSAHSSAAAHHGFQGKAAMRMLPKLLSPVSL